MASGCCSAESGSLWHLRAPVVDGVDDLGVVDPAQIREVILRLRMPELALITRSGTPFAGHLDRVRTPQLVGADWRRNSCLLNGQTRGDPSGGTDPPCPARRVRQARDVLVRRGTTPTAELCETPGGRTVAIPKAGWRLK